MNNTTGNDQNSLSTPREPKRCAIYARYSSDQQRETSIHDQVRKARDYAEKQDWVVLEDYILYDQAISGAKFEERGSLQRLLEAAEQRPRPFDVVLIDDSSRLARNLEDARLSFKILDFNGVELVSVSQGIHSNNPAATELFTIYGMMDERFLKDLAHKVLRGQEGCVLNGYIAGGKCYGYKNIPVEDPTRRGDYGRPYVIGVKRQVVAEEAAIVRRIFESYATGLSFEKIARILRAENIPAPRPPRRDSIRAWCSDSISEILRNEIYIGKYIFKRTTNVRDPKTRRMVTRQLPESEWIRSEHPELRIITNELWNKVQEQRALRNSLGFRKLGGLERTKRSQEYLFSGLLFCGASLPDAPGTFCNRAITIVDADAGRKFACYGCGAHRYKGACTNAITIGREVLEEQILDWLGRDLLHSDRLEEIVASVQTSLESKLSELQRDASKNALHASVLRQELADKRHEASSLTDFIIANGRSSWPTIKERLALTDARITEIQQLLDRASSPEPLVKLSADQIKECVVGRLRDINRVLTTSRQEGKQIIRRHIRKIMLTPDRISGKAVLRASVEFNLNAVGKPAVVPTGEVEGSSQHYGFETLLLTGLVLEIRRRQRAKLLK